MKEVTPGTFRALHVGLPCATCMLRPSFAAVQRVSLENLPHERNRKKPFATPERFPVPANRSSGTEDEHQVLPFRPRNRPGKSGDGWRGSLSAGHSPAPPVAGLEKYERNDGDDNYRHRMLVNFAALLVTILLSATGVWLAMQIADLRKNQDCVLSGRRNCMPIEVRVPQR